MLMAPELSAMALVNRSLPTIMGRTAWRAGIWNENNAPWIIDATSMWVQ